jgi:catechol 2,3-dioxygenase-like lactoylglutathione lyase family enzyme
VAIRQLAHFAVRTRDLGVSRRFYEDVLQLRAGSRPPFAFPGAWLYVGGDETALGVVHLVSGEASAAVGDYLGVPPTGASFGTGSLDHVAFFADDWPALRARCDAAGATYVERIVPGLGLLQVFLTDPSGVTLELTFAT